MAAAGATKPEVRERLKQFDAEAKRELRALQLEFDELERPSVEAAAGGEVSSSASGSVSNSSASRKGDAASGKSGRRRKSSSGSALSVGADTNGSSSSAGAKTEAEAVAEAAAAYRAPRLPGGVHALHRLTAINASLHSLWQHASPPVRRDLVQTALGLRLFGSPRNRHLPPGSVDRAVIEEAIAGTLAPPPAPPSLASFAPSLALSSSMSGGLSAAAALQAAASEASNLARSASNGTGPGGASAGPGSSNTGTGSGSAHADKDPDARFPYPTPLRLDKAARGDEFMEHVRRLQELQGASIRHERLQMLKAQGAGSGGASGNP
jgi:hypothetical protein